MIDGITEIVILSLPYKPVPPYDPYAHMAPEEREMQEKCDEAIWQHEIEEANVNENGYYWIAINGSSVAAHLAFPLRHPIKVTPTPEILVGFHERDEAESIQKFLLTCRPEQISPLMASWKFRPDLLIIQPENPEPQTYGQTMWAEL